MPTPLTIAMKFEIQQVVAQLIFLGKVLSIVGIACYVQGKSAQG
jgi:hypothetical protein